MRIKVLIATILSLIVPGLGQIYAKKTVRGAAILMAVIMVGNLNVNWLSIYALSAIYNNDFFGVMLPRIIHDVFAIYGIIFWIWQAVDAYFQVKETYSRERSIKNVKN